MTNRVASRYWIEKPRERDGEARLSYWSLEVERLETACSRFRPGLVELP